MVLVGIREVDQPERNRARIGHAAFTMRDIDERGLRSVMEQAIALAPMVPPVSPLARHGFRRPREAPGVGTPVRGGTTYREAHLAMEMVCDSGRMLSMEVVEVNPVLCCQPDRLAGRRTRDVGDGEENSLGCRLQTSPRCYNDCACTSPDFGHLVQRTREGFG